MNSATADKAEVKILREATQRRAFRLDLAWFGAGVAIGCLLLIGVALRLDMLRHRTGIEGQYTVNIQYGAWVLATEHHLFKISGDLPVISNYTSGLNYGAVDYVSTYVYGAALTLAGLHDPQIIGKTYMSFPWQGLVLMPLAFLALYTRLCRLRARRSSALAMATIYAFTAFGHYGIVNWGLSGGLSIPLGWAVLVLIYLALFAKEQPGASRSRWTVVFIFGLLLVQPTYHTIALAVFVLVVYMLLFQRAITGHRYVFLNSANLALIVFIAFLTYHAVTFFNDYARLGKLFLSDIFRSDDAQVMGYFTRLSGTLFYLQLVSYAVIALPSACVFGLWLRHRARASPIVAYQSLWLVGLIPMGVLFFAWNGLAGVQPRLLQLGWLLSAASTAILLTLNARRLHYAAVLAVVISTAITIYSVPAIGVAYPTLLTRDEERAISWYGTHVGCDPVLYTDFRIGPTLAYEGCFRVVGPTASSLARRGQIDVLKDLLYGADPQSISSAINDIATTKGQTPDYILVSHAFTEPKTGVILPDGRLMPMPEATWLAYQHLPGWTVIYRNDTVAILARGNPQVFGKGPIP